MFAINFFVSPFEEGLYEGCLDSEISAALDYFIKEKSDLSSGLIKFLKNKNKKDFGFYFEEIALDGLYIDNEFCKNLSEFDLVSPVCISSKSRKAQGIIDALIFRDVTFILYSKEWKSKDELFLWFCATSTDCEMECRRYLKNGMIDE